jgi:hypothetical protein
MEFYIETGVLQKAVKALAVTAKAGATDFSGLISIEAKEDGQLRFVSNNSSNSLLYTLTENIIIKTPGLAVVEFGKLKSFIMSFPVWNEGTGVKDFRFTYKDHKFTINVSNVLPSKKIATAKLKVIDHDVQAVRQPMPFEKTTIILNSEVILEATSKVLYAIDPSDARPFIQGMYLYFDKDYMYFAGTNGRLISEYKFKNESGLKDVGYLLKYDFVMGLRRLLDGNKDIEFEIDDRGVKARCDEVVFYGRPIIGHQFPDYKVPLENFKNKLVLDKEVLEVASILDSLNADDNSRLTFELKNGNLYLYNDFVNLEYEGVTEYKDNFIVDLNGTFLKSTIESIKDQKILVKFTDDKAPVIFDSANYENQKGLITPLRRR